MELPKLPPKDATRGDLIQSHRGPTKRSNWVVPGRLMAGDRSSLDSEESLKAIFKSGVTTVVCLQTRQETSAGVDYRKKAKALQPNVSFVEQPIPDQEVTDDAMVEELVSQLLERLAGGEVLYVHCRGGHGRTGTICAILLGRMYKLSAAEAMARTQACHDARQQPVFAAEGYQETKDGSSCVILFPSQRQQVVRLLRGEAAVPALDRASSAAYGPGASKYPVEKMMEWQGKAKEAAEALNSGKQKTEGKEDELQKAVQLFWEAAKLRPDFARGYLGLARALRLLKQPADAKHAVLHGLEHCADDGALLQELQKIDKELEKQVIVEEAAEAELALMGLPGCGKSTFAEQLAKSGNGWHRICQDELSGRDEFERSIGPIAKDSRQRLIVDRTNVVKSDRQRHGHAV
ncbi:Cdc14b [Symbiodinium natans]|uniref:Cdc14b protein n=1 Tax=Symbiodinium natans TaxID=878477 RepID=A0A812ULJ4_9DINO|nr:Cdc14b [Symbiodinium natans]